MDIQLEKADIVRRLQHVEDESLILAFKNMLDYAMKKNISIESGRAEMAANAEASNRDIGAGRVRGTGGFEGEPDQEISHPTKEEMIARAEASNRAIREGRVKGIEQVRKESRNW